MATKYSILPNHPVHRVATTPHPADGYRAIIAGQAQRNSRRATPRPPGQNSAL